MKKTLMVKTWMVIGAAVVVIGGAVPARADQELSARVPFDFIADGVRLPAGNYVVTQQAQNALVSIASTDRRHFAFVLMNTMASDKAGPEARLGFERVGGHYFLSQVVGVSKEGRELLLTPASEEREIVRESVPLVR